MITIIDYGLGNPKSIQNMINKAGGKSLITSDLGQISEASSLILPGVGHFRHGMEQLEFSGLKTIIHEKVQSNTPLLGICLGMQLLGDESEEGECSGLGIIPGKVKKIDARFNLKVPHMGWNDVEIRKDLNSSTFFESKEIPRFYFVHSYHFIPENKEHILATTNYGGEMVCGISKGRTLGLQFHPEKSHRFGIAFFSHYISWLDAQK